MEFRGQATLAEAFAIVEQCDRTLCKYNVIDLVSLLVDTSKSQKGQVAIAGLAEVEVDKTLYCWTYGHVGHTRKDCLSKQRRTQTVGNPKRKPIVLAKDSTKGADNHLPK